MTFSFAILSLAFASPAAHATAPKITLPPAGPYHVEGNHILDSKGRPYLIRSTRLPPVTLDRPSDFPRDFGPFSGTTFISIRQRLNMNAVRLPVDPQSYESDPRYRARVKEVVNLANEFELLVIVDSIAVPDFKDNPNVFFAGPEILSLRAQGVTQPLIMECGRRACHAEAHPNVIYEVPLAYATLSSDLERLSATTIPLLATGLDPQLDHVDKECAAFPSDPGNASKLLKDLLTQFDQRSINWTISSLEPGRLIDAYRGYDWTKLDNGYTCGQPSFLPGIGMLVLSHLWNANAHGLLTVNQPGGGLIIARGANASTYGRTLARREAAAKGYPLPTRLSDISIRVTDSQGVARLAALSWTGAGWSSTNFVIPPSSAPGPAEVTVVRTDGTASASGIIITDAAPGLYTATYDGRGPAIAQVVQRSPTGKTLQFSAWKCEPGVYVVDGCRTVPIPLTPHLITTVILDGTGFRYTKSKAAIRAIVDGVSVPVEDYSPVPQNSLDHLTIRLPDTLIGRGEVDVHMIANGILSNVVRINCGSGPA